MLTEATALVRRLADLAAVDDPAGWAAGRAELVALDGRGWLLVDQGARGWTLAGGYQVSGTRGWLEQSLWEPSGFVAAVTSLHVDGRFRERAARVLAAMPPDVAAPALAVRASDHVLEVRSVARASLRQLALGDAVESALDVLLAGIDRQRTGPVLEEVRATALDEVPADVLVPRLLRSDRRRVRRWALELGRELDLVTTEQLVTLIGNDADQGVRAASAAWLARIAEPSARVALAALLSARSVEARLLAVTRVPDTHLTDEALRSLLVDRAPRVREQAQWRARRRGWDVGGFYRRVVADEASSPRTVAAGLVGLAAAADSRDLDAAVGLLDHGSARVQAAAVAAVMGLAPAEDAVRLLAPLLTDPSARVSAAAARSLGRLDVPPSTADDAWSSDHPSARRAAWRLTREAGGWHRVEADLRAVADPDPGLSSLGRAGLRTWLVVSAATTWTPLPESQRERIAGWLDRAGLGADQRRVVAFHAGITLPDEPRRFFAVEEPGEATVLRRPWWRRFGAPS